jgi:ribosomal protein S18 acetylase RimI-like enzyme
MAAAAEAREIVIRPIRPEEFEALGELIVAAYRQVSVRLASEDAYYRQLRDVATRARTSCVLVATTPDGRLLGGVTYVSGPDDPYSEELAEGEAGMRMLAVDPLGQGRGVGRALAQACLDRAREAGRRRLVLHTGHWMPAAVHLYESMGFERVPELDFTPVPGVNLLAYAFELRPTTG